MVRSTNLCFLCQKRADEQGALHRIPKNSTTRPAWLTFCNLDESIDDISKVLICSRHFLLTDYVEPQARALGTKLILKPGSIPSILKPQCRPQFATTVDAVVSTCSKVETSTFSLHHSEPPEFTGPSTRTQSIIERPPKKCKGNMSVETLATEIQVTTLKNLQPIVELNVGSELATCSRDTQSQMAVTPKRQRYLEPRYVGDVRSPHLSTPQRAKRSFNLAKRTIAEQTERIRRLQQKNRNLIKRIKNFEELLTHSRVISESSADIMVVYQS